MYLTLQLHSHHATMRVSSERVLLAGAAWMLRQCSGTKPVTLAAVQLTLALPLPLTRCTCMCHHPCRMILTLVLRRRRSWRSRTGQRCRKSWSAAYAVWRSRYSTHHDQVGLRLAGKCRHLAVLFHHTLTLQRQAIGMINMHPWQCLHCRLRREAACDRLCSAHLHAMIVSMHAFLMCWCCREEVFGAGH